MMASLNRIKVSIITGAALGVVCIIGAMLRMGFLPLHFLFAFWYNRVLMGVVVGLAPGGQGTARSLLRGAVIGLLVSFAFYSSTGFVDTTGFAAGIIYGVIIEYVAMTFGG